MNALSLHIGLNQIDPAVYGTDGTLTGCINDARSMQALASSLGYKTSVLLDNAATVGNVTGAIIDAANQLESGDMFFLTYAGHGSQVPDITADEPDGYDETWCLYDRMLLDDELYFLWGSFKAGVRIAVVSDSCHSGTIVRNILEMMSAEKIQPTYRFLDNSICETVFNNLRSCYEPIKQMFRNESRGAIGASVILLSGCQDNQLSADGHRNGLFTEYLLKTWSNGGFSGTYQEFVNAIVKSMKSVTASQTPNYLPIGAPNLSFEAQTPFSREGSRSPNGHILNETIDFTLHIDKSLIQAFTDKELEEYLRTKGTDVLAAAYADWKVTVGRIKTIGTRGEWEVKAETNTHTGETTVSGSVKGTF